MRRLLFLVTVFSPALALAAQAGISRGGFGLLFADHNSSQNLGQTARSPGFSVQALGAKFTGTHEQAVVLSAAFARGGWALSAYGSRYGMDPKTNAASEDIFGVGAGFAASDFSFGFTAEKEQDVYRTIARASTAASVRGTVTYETKGPLVLGLALRTTVDAAVRQEQTLEVAAGWKMSNAGIELLQTVSSRSGDWSTGLLGRWSAQSFYIAGGGIYLGLPEAVQILARAGLVWGALDISGFVTHIVKDSENPFHGITLRAAF
jgi:hypothetical protein